VRTCPKCGETFADEMDFCPRDGTGLLPSVTAHPTEALPPFANRFRIIKRLGAGGMGTVFLAEQIAVGNRPVALKTLLRKLLNDPEFLARFRSEAASTGRIRHSNVVTIYESGQDDDGTPYIAMEYLEGETLRRALQARGALPASQVAEITHQVGRGLSAAHKLGIIHRDLKPENIFLTRDDEGALLVKVLDFGIAKLREIATHTQTGVLLGTPAYMSYEQASGMRSDQLDTRSDIYSLGVIAYEMLSGRVPFASDTPLGYVRKHLTEEPPPFRSTPGLEIPEGVEAALLKALKKDRDQRYPSAADFAREFAEAARMVPVQASGRPLHVTTIPPPVAESRLSTEQGTPTAGATEIAVQTPPGRRPESAKPAPEGSVFLSPEPAPSLGTPLPPGDSPSHGMSPAEGSVSQSRPQIVVGAPRGSQMAVFLLSVLLVVAAGTTFTLYVHRRTPPTTSAPAVLAPSATLQQPVQRLAEETNAASNATSPPLKMQNVAPTRIHVAGPVEEARVLYHASPPYPDAARSSGQQGTVRLGAVIAKDGVVRSLKPISGPSLLVPAAMNAVRNWTYKPTLAKGAPVEVETEIDVNFTPPPTLPPPHRDGAVRQAAVHFQRGKALARDGSWDEAIAQYRQAIDLNPDFAKAHLELGVALGHKQDWDGEIAQMQEAIRLNNDLAEAHENLGAALGWKKDWDGEIAEERTAIGLKPDSPQAHNALGFALEHKGLMQDAFKELSLALQLNPDSPAIQANYERVARRLGRK
jgi:eukaryotic-like serine/threonine-protein kinase